LFADDLQPVPREYMKKSILQLCKLQNNLFAKLENKKAKAPKRNFGFISYTIASTPLATIFLDFKLKKEALAQASTER
ncbi:hypothetical protein ACQ1PR_06640, partial [Ornithobacterium rhinotracheale]